MAYLFCVFKSLELSALFQKAVYECQMLPLTADAIFMANLLHKDMSKSNDGVAYQYGVKSFKG